MKPIRGTGIIQMRNTLNFFLASSVFSSFVTFDFFITIKGNISNNNPPTTANNIFILYIPSLSLNKSCIVLYSNPNALFLLQILLLSPIDVFSYSLFETVYISLLPLQLTYNSLSLVLPLLIFWSVTIAIS